MAEPRRGERTTGSSRCSTPRPDPIPLRGWSGSVADHQVLPLVQSRWSGLPGAPGVDEPRLRQQRTSAAQGGFRARPINYSAQGLCLITWTKSPRTKVGSKRRIVTSLMTAVIVPAVLLWAMLQFFDITAAIVVALA